MATIKDIRLAPGQGSHYCEDIEVLHSTSVDEPDRWSYPASTPGFPCVPRRYDGSCGSLMDALMYEKRLETYGQAISYFDLRGWGCLLEGTPVQLPPPGRQLDLLGVPNYTFGGVGQPGGAPKPTNCPLLHRP